MNLPPDKARLLRQYDNEKKWDLICDQVRGLGQVQKQGLCLGLDKAAGPKALTIALGSLEKLWPGLHLGSCSLSVPRGCSQQRPGW